MSFFNRIAAAWDTLTAWHTMVIIIKKPAKNEQRGPIVLYGTVQDNEKQLLILKALADSIQQDINNRIIMTQGTVPGDKIYQAEPKGDA